MSGNEARERPDRFALGILRFRARRLTSLAEFFPSSPAGEPVRRLKQQKQCPWPQSNNSCYTMTTNKITSLRVLQHARFRWVLTSSMFSWYWCCWRDVIFQSWLLAKVSQHQILSILVRSTSEIFLENNEGSWFSPTAEYVLNHNVIIILFASTLVFLSRTIDEQLIAAPPVPVQGRE